MAGIESKVLFAVLTDTGCQRANNEDVGMAMVASSASQWRSRGHLFVVADGMGGHAVGELASRSAVDTLTHDFFKNKSATPGEALHQAMLAANGAVNRRAAQNRDFMRMGTTCTALAISARGAYLAHVGDSRCYRIRGDRIDQLTFDHSLQWELMRRTGEALDSIMKREPKNVITRSIGPEPVVQVDLEGPHPVQDGDVFVLMTDGICNYVTDAEIGQIACSVEPADACRLLIDLASVRGGADNMTAVIVRAMGGTLEDSTESVPEIEPLSLNSTALVAGSVLASLFVLGGLVLAAFQHELLGVIVGLPGLAIAALISVLRRHDRQHQQRRVSRDGETVYVRPYRSALAKPTLALAEDLARRTQQLRSRCQADKWPISLETIDGAVVPAEAALEQQRVKDAICLFGKAMHLILGHRPYQDVSLEEERRSKAQ